MLCPCCGFEMRLGERDCNCGARIVGEPLDDARLKVRSYGPAMVAFGSLLAVGLGFLISLWAAVALVITAWLSLRAMRLSRRDPDWFGGYRSSLASLLIALVVGGVLSVYGIAHIPLALDKRRIRREAATRSTMFQMYRLLEEYKAKYGGSYPADLEAIRKIMPSASAADSWEKNLVLRSYTEAVAEAPGRNGRLKVISLNNFELRSAGPDGKIGTADDIVMVDGVFLTGAEVARQPPAKDSLGR
jgi:hypothetical protein